MLVVGRRLLLGYWLFRTQFGVVIVIRRAGISFAERSADAPWTTTLVPAAKSLVRYPPATGVASDTCLRSNSPGLFST